jgi:hypothetical protein
MAEGHESGKVMKKQAFCECRSAVQNAESSNWRTTWSKSSQGYPQLFNRFCGKPIKASSELRRGVRPNAAAELLFARDPSNE